MDYEFNGQSLGFVPETEQEERMLYQIYEGMKDFGKGARLGLSAAVMPLRKGEPNERVTRLDFMVFPED